MFRITNAYCSLCQPKEPRGWFFQSSVDPAGRQGLSRSPDRCELLCHRSHSTAARGKQVTLVFSFEMAFFWNGNVRRHFILFMMATPQPRAIVLENHLLTDNCPCLPPAVWMQPFKYLQVSFPPTNPLIKSVLAALHRCNSFFCFFKNFLNWKLFIPRWCIWHSEQYSLLILDWGYSGSQVWECPLVHLA